MGDRAFCSVPHNRVCRKFAVEETVDGVGLPREFPSIEEDLFSLVSCNSIKHLKQGPLGLFQRELPRGNYAKQSLYSAYSEAHAHLSSTFPANNLLSDKDVAISNIAGYYDKRQRNPARYHTILPAAPA